MKKCPTCDITKSLDCFAKRNDRKSGVQSRCKECNKALKGGPYAPDETLKEKLCSKCNTTKPIAEFSLNKSMIGGYNWWCKPCHSMGNRTHYAENIEEEHVRSKAKGIRRKDAIKIYQAGWYAENKETKDAQSKAWWDEHPEKRREYTHVHRARMYEAPRYDLSEEQWQEIVRACEHRCVYCPSTCKQCDEKTHMLEREHLTPVSKGGSYTVWNILPACLPCNRRKHAGNVLSPVQPFLLTIARPKQKDSL